MKSLNILGISSNPSPNQGFHEITEMFRDFTKSLVSQSYCNIYTTQPAVSFYILNKHSFLPFFALTSIRLFLFSTEVPGAPKGPLKIEVMGHDSALLSWQPPEDNGGSQILGYIIDKRDTQRGGWIRAARVAVAMTQYQLLNLIEDHDYQFRVYAENKVGVGVPLESKGSIKAVSPYGESSHGEIVLFLVITVSRCEKNISSLYGA